MKKLMSASKRKWVLGGLLGFAAVALTTTGFATWVVGVNQTNQNGNIGVTVDTVKNKSTELTLTLSDSDIVLKEAANIDSGAVIVEDADEYPLRVTASKFELKVGAQFLEDNTITGVEFSLKYKTEDGVTEDIKDNAKNLVKTDSIGKRAKLDKTAGITETKDSWEYIVAPEKVLFTNDQIKGSAVDPNTGLYTYDIPKKDLDFQWGSYFNLKSPATYYNELFPEASLTQEYVNKIFTELNTMKETLNKDAASTFVLTAKLAFTEKNNA